jgi:hypothetical protein
MEDVLEPTKQMFDGALLKPFTPDDLRYALLAHADTPHTWISNGMTNASVSADDGSWALGGTQEYTIQEDVIHEEEQAFHGVARQHVADSNETIMREEDVPTTEVSRVRVSHCALSVDGDEEVPHA